MGSDELFGRFAALGGTEEFILVRTGDVTQTEGNTHAALIQSGADIFRHPDFLLFGRTGVDILSAGSLAEIFVTGKQRHIHGCTVFVHNI